MGTEELADVSHPPDDMVPEEWWPDYKRFLEWQDANTVLAQDALDRQMADLAGVPEDRWEEHSYGA